MMRYDPTIYQGAAVHYRYGRPAYSPGLEAVLGKELGLDGSGRLLDVGCGPGVLTVRLAHLFEEAVGLDPDPEMIAEGRRAAQERDIANITWVQALAEDLPAAAPGRTGWSPSAHPSGGRTRLVWPRRCTTCWSRAAPWCWSCTKPVGSPSRQALDRPRYLTQR